MKPTVMVWPAFLHSCIAFRGYKWASPPSEPELNLTCPDYKIHCIYFIFILCIIFQRWKHKHEYFWLIKTLVTTYSISYLPIQMHIISSPSKIWLPVTGTSRLVAVWGWLTCTLSTWKQPYHAKVMVASYRFWSFLTLQQAENVMLSHWNQKTWKAEILMLSHWNQERFLSFGCVMAKLTKATRSFAISVHRWCFGINQLLVLFSFTSATESKTSDSALSIGTERLHTGLVKIMIFCARNVVVQQEASRNEVNVSALWLQQEI